MDQLISVTIQKLKLNRYLSTENELRNIMRFLLPVMAVITWILLCISSEGVATTQAIAAGVIVCGLFLIRAMSHIPVIPGESTKNS